LEVELSKKRIVEEIEAIEAAVIEARRDKNMWDAVERKLRDLRIAIECKPVYDSIQ